MADSDSVEGPSAPFRVDEYDVSGRRFFFDAMDAVTRASHPILQNMHVERRETLAPTLNTLSPGVVVTGESKLVRGEGSIAVDAAIAGNPDDLVRLISDWGDLRAKQLLSTMFEHVDKVTEATGQVVNGKKTWEALIEAVEIMEISFDEDGEPSMPSLATQDGLHMKVDQMPPEVQARIEEIIERKRLEWLDRRRTRRLPRPGDGA